MSKISQLFLVDEWTWIDTLMYPYFLEKRIYYDKNENSF